MYICRESRSTSASSSRHLQRTIMESIPSVRHSFRRRKAAATWRSSRRRQMRQPRGGRSRGAAGRETDRIIVRAARRATEREHTPNDEWCSARWIHSAVHFPLLEKYPLRRLTYRPRKLGVRSSAGCRVTVMSRSDMCLQNPVRAVDEAERCDASLEGAAVRNLLWSSEVHIFRVVGSRWTQLHLDI